MLAAAVVTAGVTSLAAVSYTHLAADHAPQAHIRVALRVKEGLSLQFRHAILLMTSSFRSPRPQGVMIWMAFIGAALVMQEDGHYKMTAVVDALPASIRGIVRGCAVLATVAFMLILAKVGVECCMKIAAMGQKSPTLKIPMWIAYASIPAGMILSLIHI